MDDGNGRGPSGVPSAAGAPRREVRRVAKLSTADILTVRRACRMHCRSHFGRPSGTQQELAQRVYITHMFVACDQPGTVDTSQTQACLPLTTTGPTEQELGTSRRNNSCPPRLSEAHRPEPFANFYARVQLGPHAEQLLPLDVLRREHPQLLIDYLLSTTLLL